MSRGVGMTLNLSKHPEMARVVDYVRENGPCTVAQMRRDGFRVEQGWITRLKGEGILRRSGSVKDSGTGGWVVMWRV